MLLHIGYDKTDDKYFLADFADEETGAYDLFSMGKILQNAFLQ